MSQLIKPQIKWTQEKIDLLKKEYPNENKDFLCQKLGIKRKTLKAAAQRFNVKSLQDKNLYKLKKLLKDDCLNYYWYGFIMADGHIGSGGYLRVSLSSIDFEHLKKLGNYLNVKIIIKKIETYGKSREYCYFSCKDIVFGNKLKEKLKIKENKTYNPPNLEWLDEDWKFLSFFCGFIDGDGMIQKHKNGLANMIRISCHKNWLPNMEWFSNELFKRFNIISKTGFTSRGYCYLTIYRFEQLKFLKLKFLKLDLPFMERKWMKIDECRTCNYEIKSKHINLINKIK